MAEGGQMKYTSLTEERFRISVEPWRTNLKFLMTQCWLRARPVPQGGSGVMGSAGSSLVLEVRCPDDELCVLTRTNRVNEAQVKEVAQEAALRYLKGELDKPHARRDLGQKKFPTGLRCEIEYDALSKGDVPRVDDDPDVLRRRRDFLSFRILQEIEARDLKNQARAGLRELCDSDDVWAEGDEVKKQVKALERGELIASESGGFLLTPKGEQGLRRWRQERPWRPEPDKGHIGFN
jgi:hypothetical protein